MNIAVTFHLRPTQWSISSSTVQSQRTGHQRVEIKPQAEALLCPRPPPDVTEAGRWGSTLTLEIVSGQQRCLSGRVEHPFQMRGSLCTTAPPTGPVLHTARLFSLLHFSCSSKEEIRWQGNKDSSFPPFIIFYVSHGLWYLVWSSYHQHFHPLCWKLYFCNFCWFWDCLITKTAK